MVIDSLINNDIYYKVVQIGNQNALQGFGGLGSLINFIILFYIINTAIAFFRGGNMPGGGINPMNAAKLCNIQ